LFTLDCNTSNLPAGIYFAALSDGRANRVQKLMLIR